MKKLTLLAAAATLTAGSIAFVGTATAEEAKSERQAAMPLNLSSPVPISSQ